MHCLSASPALCSDPGSLPLQAEPAEERHTQFLPREKKGVIQRTVWELNLLIFVPKPLEQITGCYLSLNFFLSSAVSESALSLIETLNPKTTKNIETSSC